MMKKFAIRCLSLWLSCLLMLGCVVPSALAGEEGAYSESEYAALAASLYGDEMPGVGSGVMIGGLKHLLGSGGGFVEGKGWDTLWNMIFGGDDTNQQIIESLERIEGKLDDILRQLGNLKNLLKERSFQDRLTDKLQQMDDANTVLKVAIAEFDKGTTREEKMTALDVWFDYKPKGYPNAFYFFANYCDRVAGAEYDKTSYFAFYDQIADLKWNFDHEGAAFRQMQREADIQFVTKMGSMLSLWLYKEMQDGSGYVSKHTPAELNRYKLMLEEGLEKVIHVYDAHPVQIRPDVIGFHVYSGETRIAFDIYTGELMPGNTAQTVNLHQTLVDSLKKGKTIEQAEEAMRTLLAQSLPVTDMYGEHFSLITRGGIAALEMAAKDKGNISIKELLLGANFPGGDWRFALYSDAEKENAPMRFGKPASAYMGIARRLDISNLNLEGTGKDLEARTLLGYAYVIGPSLPHSAQFARPPYQSVYYEAVHEDYRMVDRIRGTGYLPIWIANGQNIPIIEDVEEEAPAEQLKATVLVDSIADGTLAGTCVEPEDFPISFFLDDRTVLSEGVTRETLLGKTVSITYEMMDEQSWREGMPTLRATRIDLAEPDATKQMDGAVLRIESAMQIIGGTEDLVVESGGREYIFDLTEDTVMDDGVTTGVMVRVAYHETSEGIRRANAVVVTGMNPVPAPEVIEGSIAELHREDMPGSQGTLALAIPGGKMTLSIPTGILTDTLRQGMLVRVTYHTQNDVHTVDQISVIGDPSPDDDKRVVDGIVTRYDISLGIIGQPPLVAVAIPGGELEFSAPYGLPDALDVGASVHVHYHVLDGVNIADDISVSRLPTPDPDDPVPAPVPAPVQAWVEGYVISRLDDASVMMPGQMRELVVSAAGQAYSLFIPEHISLADDVQVDAFVHVDYTIAPDGRNLVDAVFVMQPAPQPTDDPMPGPIDEPTPGPVDDPMPGPIDEPFNPVYLP